MPAPNIAIVLNEAPITIGLTNPDEVTIYSNLLAQIATLTALLEAQGVPFAGAVPMTVGTTYGAQRSVGVLCTVAGNIEFQFTDASTLTLPAYVGWQTFPFACIQIVAAGTTATATFFNLK